MKPTDLGCNVPACVTSISPVVSLVVVHRDLCLMQLAHVLIKCSCEYAKTQLTERLKQQLAK